MIEFKNRIVQFGFGAVGKSFFEKVSKEIKFDKDNYFIISRDKLEYTFFLELGGKVGNFIVADINRKNFKQLFSKYLNEGDLLIDFADGVGGVVAVAGDGIKPVVAHGFGELCHLFRSPLVGPDDGRPQEFAAGIQQHGTHHMAGKTDPHDLRGSHSLR